jgi:hypothetical protein
LALILWIVVSFFDSNKLKYRRAQVLKWKLFEQNHISQLQELVSRSADIAEIMITSKEPEKRFYSLELPYLIFFPSFATACSRLFVSFEGCKFSYVLFRGGKEFFFWRKSEPCVDRIVTETRLFPARCSGIIRNKMQQDYLNSDNHKTKNVA